MREDFGTHFLDLRSSFYKQCTSFANIVMRSAFLCDRPPSNIFVFVSGRRHYIPERKVKLFMYQLLRSIDHMHRWVLSSERDCVNVIFENFANIRLCLEGEHFWGFGNVNHRNTHDISLAILSLLPSHKKAKSCSSLLWTLEEKIFFLTWQNQNDEPAPIPAV